MASICYGLIEYIVLLLVIIYIKVVHMIAFVSIILSHLEVRKADYLIRLLSWQLRDRGSHRFRKLNVISRWPSIAKFNKNTPFLKRIDLYLYDISAEPLRDRSWQELFFFCCVENQYRFGMKKADEYKNQLETNRHIYKDNEYSNIHNSINIAVGKLERRKAGETIEEILEYSGFAKKMMGGE